MATRFAASLALIAFAAVCLQGFVGGFSADGLAFAPVMKRALAAMLLFGGVGAVIGVLARNAVNESVQREIQTLEAAERDAESPPADEPETGPNGEPTRDAEPSKAEGAAR